MCTIYGEIGLDGKGSMFGYSLYVNHKVRRI